ncbi:MFS transporter [Hirschia baltica]|uniref:Major facilitator superfamily MFS_1 n=1 Tax=Hirschia baltica (strain ATCC 49814 / DSM 5838 / IFAM 1418) TaxID=582402 RepID=C6XN12_HIRBI|nr:MFS transporter [Hirschia baltica]ACT58182.1 major facilitator superfamily MFS_1 [Hirschia baltica ATCC 49814]
MSQKRFAAFQHNSYVRYFIARFLTTFAVQILSVSVGWQIYDLTKEPIWLGWIGLVQFLPALLLVFVTGLSADKYGRRLIMGISYAVEALCAVAILALAMFNQISPIPVLIILTIFGIGRAFASPAVSALAVNVVPKEDFANAVAWNSSSWQSATIVGPVIGGLLYGISAETAYSAASLFLIASTLLVFTIPKPKQRKSIGATSFATVVGGFTFIWKEKVILGAISLDLFAVLLGGAVALLPVYASDILQLGPAGLGLLRAAPGIGALIMVGIITSFHIRSHVGLILFACVALFGASTIVFGFSTSAWVAIPALMFIGAFDMVSVYIRETLLQLWTPDEMRSRVNAVNSIFLGASNELGEFRAGTMAHAFGAVSAVVIGGFATIGVAASWALLFPAIRKTQNLDVEEKSL